MRMWTISTSSKGQRTQASKLRKRLRSRSRVTFTKKHYTSICLASFWSPRKKEERWPFSQTNRFASLLMLDLAIQLQLIIPGCFSKAQMFQRSNIRRVRMTKSYHWRRLWKRKVFLITRKRLKARTRVTILTLETLSQTLVEWAETNHQSPANHNWSV